MSEEEIKELLKKNSEYLEAIYKNSEKTKRYIFLAQIFSFLKILIIIIPLVLAFIYLFPMLKKTLASYESLFKDSPAGIMDELKENPQELEKLLKKIGK